MTGGVSQHDPVRVRRASRQRAPTCSSCGLWMAQALVLANELSAHTKYLHALPTDSPAPSLRTPHGSRLWLYRIFCVATAMHGHLRDLMKSMGIPMCRKATELHVIVTPPKCGKLIHAIHKGVPGASTCIVGVNLVGVRANGKAFCRFDYRTANGCYRGLASMLDALAHEMAHCACLRTCGVYHTVVRQELFVCPPPTVPHARFTTVAEILGDVGADSRRYDGKGAIAGELQRARVSAPPGITGAENTSKEATGAGWSHARMHSLSCRDHVRPYMQRSKEGRRGTRRSSRVSVSDKPAAVDEWFVPMAESECDDEVMRLRAEVSRLKAALAFEKTVSMRVDGGRVRSKCHLACVGQQARDEVPLPDDTKKSVYIGHFRDGKRNGKGIMKYDGGCKYVGDWKDGKWHGYGTCYWADGSKYQGPFRGGMLHGEDGVLTYANGDQYEGSWRHDKRHGKGVITYANGVEYDGEWLNNEPVSRAAFKKSAASARGEASVCTKSSCAACGTKALADDESCLLSALSESDVDAPTESDGGGSEHHCYTSDEDSDVPGTRVLKRRRVDRGKAARATAMCPEHGRIRFVRSTKKGYWKCDRCGPKGEGGYILTETTVRWTCPEGCDYDLCSRCY